MRLREKYPDLCFSQHYSNGANFINATFIFTDNHNIKRDYKLGYITTTTGQILWKDAIAWVESCIEIWNTYDKWHGQDKPLNWPKL